MKSSTAVLVIALTFVPLTAQAGERVGDAALGALSGAFVFGPVGLVAGAVVGFTAGPSIAQSWRDNRNHPRRHAVRVKGPVRAAARQRAAAPAPAKPEAGSVAPQSPAEGSMLPVNGFE
jgi:hypothetical protein